MNARHLTVRRLPPKLSSALQAERRRRGSSLNQTVIELLTQALGVDGPRSNGIARLAGTWSKEQLRKFEEATASFENVDAEMWR